MSQPGRVSLLALSDGRTLEYWEGGDPGGRPVILHDGTPATYALAFPVHQLAVEHGVRLLSLHRPGYGRSTPATASLARVGVDTAELARTLGLPDYAVVGISGGGPFAAATAVLDAEHVRAVAIIDAIGPWTTLEPAAGNADERALLADLESGGTSVARAAFLGLAESQFGGLRAMDDQARLDAFLGAFDPSVAADPDIRSAWATSLGLVLDVTGGLEGYVFDNLAWGGPWDVDISAVTAPTALWFSEGETGQPSVHGRWYADRIPDARMTVLAGLDHLQICAGSWPRILPVLLAAWEGTG